MIKEIYAIEISGVCNSSCSYCPYSKQQRERGFMDWKTLERVLSLIKSGQVYASRPLHLHLFGEPLLHGAFVDKAATIKEVCSYISFSTNGIGLTTDLAEKLGKIGFDWITISPHDNRKASNAYYLLKACGNNVRMHGGPDHNWAGQVNHAVTWQGPCDFEKYSKAVVRWNGDMAVCCITDNGEGVVGSIYDDDILTKDLPEIPMCKMCHLKRGGNYDRMSISQSEPMRI